MDNENLNSMNDMFQLFEFKKILIIIIGFIFIGYLARLISKFSKKAENQFPSNRLLFLQIATVINFVLYICGSVLLVYVVINPPRELLLTLGGSAAVAIGFSLKDIVSSILAGLILLFDRPFQVGDRVQFENIYGEILSIGLRTVRLNTLDDSVVTIPNSKFLTEAVSSGNSGALDMMVVIDFNLSYDSDLEMAQRLLKEVVSTSRYAYLKKPISVVFSEKCSGEVFYIEMKVKAYVLDVNYEKPFSTDVVLRGNQLLRKNKVLRPQKYLYKAPEFSDSL